MLKTCHGCNMFVRVCVGDSGCWEIVFLGGPISALVFAVRGMDLATIPCCSHRIWIRCVAATVDDDHTVSAKVPTHQSRTQNYANKSTLGMVNQLVDDRWWWLFSWSCCWILPRSGPMMAGIQQALKRTAVMALISMPSQQLPDDVRQLNGYVSVHMVSIDFIICGFVLRNTWY